MKRTATTTVRVRVTSLASALRAMHNAGELPSDQLSMSRGIALMVDACAASLPPSARFDSPDEAWRWLVKHGCVGYRDAPAVRLAAVSPQLLAPASANPSLHHIVARVDKSRQSVAQFDSGPSQPQLEQESQDVANQAP